MSGLGEPIDPRELALHSHPVGDNCGQEEKDLPANSRVETEESLDALIAELEDEDGKEPDPEVLSIAPGTEQPVPAAILATNPVLGLNNEEVEQARAKYGWNQLKQESKNNLFKFLMLFVGPVQVVMEVCSRPHQPVWICLISSLTHRLNSSQLSSPPVLRTGLTLV